MYNIFHFSISIILLFFTSTTYGLGKEKRCTHISYYCIISNLNVNSRFELSIKNPDDTPWLYFKQYMNIKYFPSNVLIDYKNFDHIFCLDCGLEEFRTNETLPFTSNITFIRLSDNKLTNIDSHTLGQLPLLKSLVLDHNLVSTLTNDTFVKNVKLVNLLLHHNKIDLISENAFQNLILLQELDLSGNLIKTLPENLFQFNLNMRSLNLSSNQIEFIPGNIFEQFNKLERLNLDGNKIKQLSLNMAELLTSNNGIKEFSLHKNNWKCHSLTVIVNQFREKDIDYGLDAKITNSSYGGINCMNT